MLVLLLLLTPTTCKNNKKALANNVNINLIGNIGAYSYSTFGFSIDTCNLLTYNASYNKRYENLQFESRKSKTKRKAFDDAKTKTSTEKVKVRLFTKLKGVNPLILQALDNYEGPSIKVTSGLRHSGYKRSLHRIGKAIDIHYNKNFVMWCNTDEGKKWLNDYNLEFFVEDTHDRDFDQPELDKRFRIIPWATGLHIHINIKK